MVIETNGSQLLTKSNSRLLHLDFFPSTSMNQTTQQTDSRHPRPNPRFAGVERILVVGVEKLTQGISDKNIGLIVTGLLIILLAVGLWVVFHHNTKIRLWCYQWRRPAPSSLEDGEELVEISAPPVSGLPVSVQPIQTYI